MISSKKILFLFSFFIFQMGFAQQVDFLKIRKYQTAILSDSLRENSGLDFFKNRLFTFNDSGNTSEIFEIDKNSGNIKKIFKTHLQNKDWEAMASDSLHLYIGDIGNNEGLRKDLMIYRIPLNDSLDLNSTKTISYFYPEQETFEAKNLNTNFDAEAMIFLNGKIHLFTKEWASKKTTHYAIDPEISEDQAAEKVETFPMGYVVTDASYFDKKLYLIGYTKKTEVFLSVFNEIEPGIFFDQKPQKYYLGSALSIGQIEGIAADESGIYISGEELVTPFGKSKQRIYFVPYQNLK